MKSFVISFLTSIVITAVMFVLFATNIIDISKVFPDNIFNQDNEENIVVLPNMLNLTAEEAQVFADAFAAGGFTAPINWYRNWTRNWETTAGTQQLVTVPTLFIEAVDDVIISPQQIAAMKPHVTDLTIQTLENCGHWSQQEKPDAVNELLIDWLAARSN